MSPDEQAQVDDFIAAGKMTVCPTVMPEDASVEGFLAQIRKARKNNKNPKWKRSVKRKKK